MVAHQDERLSVALDPETEELVSQIAKRRKITRSAAAAELLREAVDRHEDRALSKVATRREQSSRRKVPHNKAW